MNQPQQEKCAYCGEKLKRITKHLPEDGTQTQTYTFICVNPDCCLKIEKSKVKTWK